MRSSFRISVGFGLGCLLSICAFALAGAGHGTYTPLTANAPMLIIIPEVGVLAALLGTPLLWAAYFLAIPEINSRILRLLAVALVALVHLGTGTWMASRDTYLPRMFAFAPLFTVFYFGLLIVVVVMLGVLAGLGTKRVREIRLS
jgi:hypothetical protein